MFETTKNKLVEHLKEHLKIEKNSLIWLHTSITGLGILKGGLNLITNAFDEILSDGALVVPTFTYSWCFNETFDPLNTPCKKMGSYASQAWRDKRFVRNNNPNFSVAITDNTKNKIIQKSILKNETALSCFGKGSAFHNMYDLSKKMPSYIILLGGAHDDVVFRTTFLHYIEEDIGVPYRYSKKFFNPINKLEHVSQYVRFISKNEYINVIGKQPPQKYNFPIIAKYKSLGSDLINENILTSKNYGYSKTRIVTMNKFCDWLKLKLSNDKEYLMN